jgi:hypothetical protein
MKITKEQLKKIIKEEISTTVSEAGDQIEGSEMEKHIQSLTKRVFELEKALKSMRGEV